MTIELLMTVPLHPHCMEVLERDYIVHRYWEADDKAALLRDAGPRIRAIAAMGALPGPETLLPALPALEIVASFGVGYDGIPVPLVRSQGAHVTNTPDVLNDAVAELTIGLMIALCRRILQTDAYVRDGSWSQGDYQFTAQLTGAKVGILGLGRIGREIARRCEAMKLEVSYFGRHRQEGITYPYYSDLEAMAVAVDWLVVIAPGGAETRHIVSRPVMAALGPEGALVNMARGSLVDEAALSELLASGALGGAALDVYEDEPRPHPGLLGLENVVLSPHQGSATIRTRHAMAQCVIDNLSAHFAGRPLISEVLA